ncbi:MAG: response regulator transcription factor [Methylophaga sp.]|nr:response regulator transcription factor [Methylophaga sp.]
MDSYVTEKASLFQIMPDSLLQQMAEVDSFAQYYETVSFESIDSLLREIDSEPALLLCHQESIGNGQKKLLNEVRSVSPNTRVLVIGEKQSMQVQIEALKQGARGYFDQTMSVSKLHEALQLLLRGEVWVERHVISGLIDDICLKPQVDKEKIQAVKTLSPKELEVAELVSHGATNKMIARRMDITERTVKAHLTAIFQKLGIADRLSLAILFRDLR